MTVRIGEYVLSGELRNTSRNSVFGWIEFAPDYGIRIELTGNFSGALEGKQIRFKVARADVEPLPEPEDLPEFVNELADRQIGVVGDMLLRKVQVPDMPIDDFLDLPQEEKAAHLVEHDSLYLEWYSQNGRIQAEVIDPIVEFVDDADAGSEYAGIDELEEDDEEPEEEFSGTALADELDDEDDDEDPYGLFGTDFDQRVAESLAGASGDQPTADLPADESSEKRPWEEVIPDIDPDTKAMYEQWDEIFEGKKDQPITYLFKTPLRLPRADRVTSDEEAEPLVRAILAQLALLSVALDVCEHFTPLDTYRLLLNEILPTAKVHPDLAASEMVQHYATSDFCPQCEAEFDTEFDPHAESEDADESDDHSGGGPEDGPQSDE